MLTQLDIVYNNLIEALLDSTQNALILGTTLAQELKQTLIGIKDFRAHKRYKNIKVKGELGLTDRYTSYYLPSSASLRLLSSM